jgi:hypothetical protein
MRSPYMDTSIIPNNDTQYIYIYIYIMNRAGPNIDMYITDFPIRFISH